MPVAAISCTRSSTAAAASSRASVELRSAMLSPSEASSVVTPTTRMPSATSISISVKPASARATAVQRGSAIPVVLAVRQHDRELHRAADADGGAGSVLLLARTALTAREAAQRVAIAGAVAHPLALDLGEAAGLVARERVAVDELQLLAVALERFGEQAGRRPATVLGDHQRDAQRARVDVVGRVREARVVAVEMEHRAVGRIAEPAGARRVPDQLGAVLTGVLPPGRRLRPQQQLGVEQPADQQLGV